MTTTPKSDPKDPKELIVNALGLVGLALISGGLWIWFGIGPAMFALGSLFLAGSIVGAIR